MKPNLPPRMSARLLKWSAAAVILAAAALVALLFWPAWTAPRVRAVFPTRGAAAGPWTKIGVRFTAPVDPANPGAFTILPALSGRVEAAGDWAWFVPAEPLRPGTAYTVTFQGRTAAAWQFQVRTPAVVYFAAGGEWGDLWAVSAGGGRAWQLTATGGRVLDFAPAPDGEWVAYAQENELRGADLWVVDRGGKTRRKIADCGAERCWSPAWPPAGATAGADGRVAYSRMSLAAGASSAPRIWTAALDGSGAAPLYQDPSVQGVQPSWSPDGRRFAAYDGSCACIRILDLQTGANQLIPATVDQVGAWSPDGAQMIFLSQNGQGQDFAVDLFKVDLLHKQVTVFAAQTSQRFDYSLPDWSRAGWVAAAARAEASSPARQLWLFDADGLNPQRITDDLGFNFASFHWDPWGTSLVFQRYDVSQSGGAPVVAVWRQADRQVTILARGAALPAWLP
jgi:Tol biopolymer transport system component